MTPYRIFDSQSARAAANLPRGTRVALAIAGVDPDVAARDQSRINALLGECGCRLSSAVLVASVCAATAIDILGWTVFVRAPAPMAATELLLVFAATGIGRRVGVANARRELRAVLASIGDRIDGDPQPRRASWAA